MVFREKLQQSPEYQAMTTETTPSGGGGQSQTQQQGGGQVSVPDGAGTVVSLEKNDLEFWLQVFTVILLYMILQELRRGGTR